jgi:hypothetical protein
LLRTNVTSQKANRFAASLKKNQKKVQLPVKNDILSRDAVVIITFLGFNEY